MAKVKKLKSVPKVYEFTVSLEGTDPLVWRKFLAHEIISLDELHFLIQMTMGWEASHLFEFKFGDKFYVHSDHAEEMNALSTEGLLLIDALGDKNQFWYIYDFGDNWEHKVKITNILEHDPKVIYPVCTGGENACPPEDCGGPGAYHELKKILAGKDSRQKDELLEWVGGFFNPTTFDPNLVNRYLLWNDGSLGFDELEY